MKINEKMFNIAYKKLKSSLYYDKTQLIARDKLVEFESEDIDKKLRELSSQFSDAEEREKLINNILSSISCHVFPKSLVEDKSQMIRNFNKKNIEIKDNQYFIDMDIRGAILGVLWIMTIGYRVDKEMYVHSYGNRIRKKLINELSEAPTYSPYLFEPYFQQYESWRDNAMDAALKHLHSGQDAVILTLDFKRFYYSVDITEELLDEIYNDSLEEEERNEELWALNKFVYNVILKYSELLIDVEECRGRRILPIGFLPSNIIANYALRNFDQAILDGWNPIYFGRYVDDVIIVDKVEKKSDIYTRIQKEEIDAEKIIYYFLEQCSGWKGLKGTGCENDGKHALLLDISKICKNNEWANMNEIHEIDKYSLNPKYNPIPYDNSEIRIKDEKVKVFYFKCEESDALITCFRDTISKNKSEFRFMPDDDSVFQRDDFSHIYDLQNNETINKFRGITGITIDKFELSKLLGKNLRIGGLISDLKETGLEMKISKILSSRVIIENYIVWEKVIEILAINGSFDTLQSILENILKAIEALYYKSDKTLKAVKRALFMHLEASICRSLSLVWGDEIDEKVKRFCEKRFSGIDFLVQSDIEKINSKRKAYCETRMVDKSVMPVFIDMLDTDEIYCSKDTVNLTKLESVERFCNDNWMNTYKYYPFLVTMYDFSVISCITELKKERNSFDNPIMLYTQQMENYLKSNYDLSISSQKADWKIRVEHLCDESLKSKSFCISVGSENKDKLRLAIANVRLNHNNFERVVKGSANRSYQRYRDMSKMINDAIKEHADMLVMPEAYMPFEWVLTVARTCARNNLAIVSGIEHIKVGDRIYNLTAVILPYEDNFGRSAFISFHLKTHYAPAEKQEINGYGLCEKTGSMYELYRWNDCYFPVYCCYELTSILDRAMFQSYADFMVAIEWNKDINYYSNILEALSRDIHCYCIQVNSADYGDSRITKPSRTEEKDILRTKGGINSTILVDEIDIRKIRDFQLKQFDLQEKDKSFKPTPPGFRPDIVLKKIKREKLTE